MIFLWVLVALVSFVGVTSSAKQGSGVSAGLDTPITMVPNGVADIELVDAADKVFSHQRPVCYTEPPAASPTVDDEPGLPELNYTKERINRITSNALYTRTLYAHTVDRDCGDQDFSVLSNVAADGSDSFWQIPAEIRPGQVRSPQDGF